MSGHIEPPPPPVDITDDVCEVEAVTRLAEKYTTWFHGKVMNRMRKPADNLWLRCCERVSQSASRSTEGRGLQFNQSGSYSFYRGRARVFNEDSPVAGFHEFPVSGFHDFLFPPISLFSIIYHCVHITGVRLQRAGGRMEVRFQAPLYQYSV